jgi:hypothetical protein
VSFGNRPNWIKVGSWYEMPIIPNNKREICYSNLSDKLDGDVIWIKSIYRMNKSTIDYNRTIETSGIQGILQLPEFIRANSSGIFFAGAFF